ncbi:uncharacterized protein L969DRAFT_316093 [Mixia osmundae IAM 14324]|nr:uncharacterized protein L969DRAFT_316093 [Mixia osmundae IAM 14324]KEI41560.1 hypothetical protein L969DRAFT_316093 [Mixia osmundae IAM 14324]
MMTLLAFAALASMATALAGPNFFDASKYPFSGAGDGTFYSNSADGNACLLPAPLIPTRFAAVAAPIWNGSALCGACARVTGDNGNTVDVQLLNECGNCAGAGNLDMSDEAWLQVYHPLSIGRAHISWELIDCAEACLVDEPDVPQVMYKQHTTKDWAAVQPQDITAPLMTFELKNSQDANFRQLYRQNFNYWTLTKDGGSFGPGPWTYRGTFADGTTKIYQSNSFNIGEF